MLKLKFRKIRILSARQLLLCINEKTVVEEIFGNEEEIFGNEEEIFGNDEVITDNEEEIIDNKEEIIQSEKEDIEEVIAVSSKTTELSHGGDEATKDIKDSPNPADDGEQQNRELLLLPEADKLDETEESQLEVEKGRESEKKEEDFLTDFYKRGKRDPNAESSFGAIKRVLDYQLKKQLFRTISRLAEELTFEKRYGHERWDVDALLSRTFDKRLLSKCRYTPDRKKLSIIIDTSGSCKNWAHLFGSIAKMCTEYASCDIYYAPNCSLEYYYNSSSGAFERLWTFNDILEESECVHPYNFNGGTVFFFGDVDGAHELFGLAKISNLYWFSNETRYDILTFGDHHMGHSWCRGLDIRDFEGEYIPAVSRDELLTALRKLRLKY